MFVYIYTYINANTYIHICAHAHYMYGPKPLHIPYVLRLGIYAAMKFVILEALTVGLGCARSDSLALALAPESRLDAFWKVVLHVLDDVNHPMPERVEHSGSTWAEPHDETNALRAKEAQPRGSEYPILEVSASNTNPYPE